MVAVYLSTGYLCIMLINELARRSGVSAHTIRFYERSGLIKGMRDEKNASNNYFHYDEETVDRLEFVHDAKSVGFTIREIGQMIDAWYTHTYTRREKLEILDARLAALEKKQKEIRDMKKRIALFKEDIMKDRC
jgi:MerR family Zn(II)-responsive transcriptional regulator of zntA